MKGASGELGIICFLAWWYFYGRAYMHVSVALSCLTLCDPMDCSLPGSSVHGIFQARIPEWVAIFILQGIFLTQGSNLHLLCLLHCRQILYLLGHQGSPQYCLLSGNSFRCSFRICALFECMLQLLKKKERNFLNTCYFFKCFQDFYAFDSIRLILP